MQNNMRVHVHNSTVKTILYELALSLSLSLNATHYGSHIGFRNLTFPHVFIYPTLPPLEAPLGNPFAGLSMSSPTNGDDTTRHKAYY